MCRSGHFFSIQGPLQADKTKTFATNNAILTVIDTLNQAYAKMHMLEIFYAVGGELSIEMRLESNCTQISISVGKKGPINVG